MGRIGQVSWNKGKKFAYKARPKLKGKPTWNKGVTGYTTSKKGTKTGNQSIEHIAKRVAKMIGHTTSEETRRKISEAQKDKPRQRHSKETKLKMGISSTLAYKEGRKIAYFKGKTAWNKGQPGLKGNKNPNWIVDRSKLQRYNDDAKDRRSSAYNAWRKEVWLRDKFACKIANPDCAGRLEAHHILGYTEYPELRYQTNNGITLCHFHHPRRREEEKRLSPYFQDLASVSR